MIIKEFTDEFEKLFPLYLAEKWDNVGLQVGDDNNDITGILLSLDLTTDVVLEAIQKGCNLIVVHHPIIFSPLKQITAKTYQGNLLQTIIKNDISVYVAHTNFDISNYGMNKILADMLELQNQKIIDLTTETEGLGRYGTLKQPVILVDYIKQVKKVFKLDSVKLIGDDSKVINTVAICGGSGSSLLNNTTLDLVDLYITGDITYHNALDSINKGLTVLDVGHNIEKNGIVELKNIINNMVLDIDCYLSSVETNPYKNA